MLDLWPHIEYIWKAHAQHPAQPGQQFRLWDKETPYAVHPLWCALTLLTETSLSKEIRENGAQALLYHDVLEDTTQSLPKNVSKEVAALVADMTFHGGFEQEKKDIWEKSDMVKLLKLYDKTSNLLDHTWMSPEKYLDYLLFTKKLAKEVQNNWQNLHIYRIIESLPTQQPEKA